MRHRASASAVSASSAGVTVSPSGPLSASRSAVAAARGPSAPAVPTASLSRRPPLRSSRSRHRTRGSCSPTRSYKAFAAGSQPSPAAARTTATASARSPGALSTAMAAMAWATWPGKCTSASYSSGSADAARAPHPPRRLVSGPGSWQLRASGRTRRHRIAPRSSPLYGKVKSAGRRNPAAASSARGRRPSPPARNGEAWAGATRTSAASARSGVVICLVRVPAGERGQDVRGRCGGGAQTAQQRRHRDHGLLVDGRRAQAGQQTPWRAAGEHAGAVCRPHGLAEPRPGRRAGLRRPARTPPPGPRGGPCSAGPPRRP